MGTFDEFHFIGSDAVQVSCAAGHPQREGLQTKDLDNLMRHFYVFGGSVYEASSPFETSAIPFSHNTYNVEGDRLVEVCRTTYQLSTAIDGPITMYTTCQECVPIFYEDRNSWRGDIGSQQPWSQWIVTFDHGKLINVRSDRCETREGVRTKLRDMGVLALPDEDRVVQREIALWREQHPTIQA